MFAFERTENGFANDPFLLGSASCATSLCKLTEENANGEKCPARRFCFHSCLTHECEILRCWNKKSCRWFGQKYFRLLMAGEDIRAAKCVYQRKCVQKLFCICSSRVGFHDEIVSECESLITLHKLLLKSDSTLLGCLSKKNKKSSQALKSAYFHRNQFNVVPTTARTIFHIPHKSISTQKFRPRRYQR
jgi:hypothetical protein